MAIEFSCPHCQELVRTADAAGGKKGRCPHCQAVVQIPTPTQPQRPSPAASAWKGQPATPSKPNPPRPAARPAARQPEQVEELPTLKPLDSVPGLTPLGSVPGLTPLGPAPASSAVGYSPLGPPPDLSVADVLSSLPAAQASGRTLAPTHIAPAPSYGAPAATNPLGTPVGYSGGYGAGYSGYHDISDAGRKGLPWQREATFDNFQDTVMMVIGEPQVAFPQMRRRGGLMNSLAYAIIGLFIGLLATTVYSVVLNLIMLMSAGAPAEGFAALGIAAAFMLLGCLILALLGAIVGSFLSAGVWHVILLVFGCTRGGFEGTYRAVCFTMGSIALLNVVPIVGPLIGMIMGIVVLIHAFIHTHEAPSGRVVTAVLIPYALLCCCMVPGVFVLLGSLMQGM